MADYTSRHGQQSRVSELALEAIEATTERRALYAAYDWLAHQPQGQVILDHLAREGFLHGLPGANVLGDLASKASGTAQLLASLREQELWIHEGKRQLVRAIFEMVRQAPGVLREGD